MSELTTIDTNNYAAMAQMMALVHTWVFQKPSMVMNWMVLLQYPLQ